MSSDLVKKAELGEAIGAKIPVQVKTFTGVQATAVTTHFAIMTSPELHLPQINDSFQYLVQFT